MSYEQYVRYKQQLRSITVEFLKVANTASNDQLEIVLARFADRVSDEPEAAFEEKYKGFLASKKLLSKENKRDCPVCGSYSFFAKDDLYMAKFECCFKCYIQWVEDSEESWESGWRPSKEQING